MKDFSTSDSPPEPGQVDHNLAAPPEGVYGRFLALLEVALVGTAGFVVIPLVMALFGIPPHRILNSPSYMAILLVSEATLTLLLIRLLLALRRETPRTIGWLFPKPWEDTAIGLLVLPLLFATTFLVKVVFHVFFPYWATVDNPILELIRTDRDLLLFVVASIYAGGVKEEIQRAFVLTRFKESLGGIYVGLVAWSLFFGYGHSLQGVDNAVGAGLLGLIFGLLFIWRRTLMAPIVAHMVYDIATLLSYRFSILSS